MDLMANPKFKSFIDQFNVLMENTQKVSLDEARRQSTEFFAPSSAPRENVVKVHDITIKAEDGFDIPVRIYNPYPDKSLPLFIYYHRGGWVFSNNVESEPVCRKFANHLGCIVAAVDFRLAPENPFPTPFNDCYNAFCWLSEHAEELGADKHKIIVGGESCGGNLAAAVALKARDEGIDSIASQLLIYPIISSTINPIAYENCADKYFLTQPAMEFFWSVYLQNSEDDQNPYASPDKTESLKNLPPALIITAEHDPLRFEAEDYANKLKQAGNCVMLERVPGVVHGFLDLPIYDDAQIIPWIKNIGLHINTQMNLAHVETL